MVRGPLGVRETFSAKRTPCPRNGPPGGPRNVFRENFEIWNINDEFWNVLLFIIAFWNRLEHLLNCLLWWDNTKAYWDLSPAGKAYSLNFKGPPLLWQHQKGSAKIRRLRTTELEAITPSIKNMFIKPWNLTFMEALWKWFWLSNSDLFLRDQH